MIKILSLALLLAAALATPSAPAARRYVCPPCGMPCDQVVHDKPGQCPACGARLVDQQSARAESEDRASRTVGILLFDGVEIIDYTGPWEVFGAAGYEVFTVAEAKRPITTAMGMTVVPRYTLAEAPQPTVLLVPGGGIVGPQSSPATLRWIAQTSARAQHTLSVCNGAFLLAKAGLLEGLSATTTYRLLDELQAEFPKVRVVRDERFVDNGRIITAGGLSSGIDGALHLVAKQRGNGAAQRVALGIEYDWRPKEGFARGALAETLIPDLNLDDLGTWTLLRTEGGVDRWEIEARAATELSEGQLLERIGKVLAAAGKWRKAPAGTPGPSTGSAWRFEDRDGRPWKGSLTVRSVPDQAGQYTATLTILRAV